MGVEVQYVCVCTIFEVCSVCILLCEGDMLLTKVCDQLLRVDNMLDLGPVVVDDVHEAGVVGVEGCI